MNHFSIRDIENLCGIKAHTLRIWEQRYGLCVAKRKQSKHRIYDNDDLKNILRVSYLYHNGHKISKIASLSPEQLKTEVENACPKEDDHESFIHQLIGAGVDFDKEKMEQLVNSMALRLGLEKAMIHVFYPFLQRIGLLWMTNHVIPAQEHFVSNIIRKKIILATDGLDMPAAPTSTVLIFAPCGEYHEIPLLLANFFFRKYGSRTIYFGDNVTSACLHDYMKEHRVTHLYTHVITYLGNECLNNYICSICKEFPDRQMIVSGAACKCIEGSPSNMEWLHSVDELVAMAKKLGVFTSASHSS